MKKNNFCIESLLLSLLICANVLKFFINKIDTNFLTFFYILFIFITLINNYKKIDFHSIRKEVCVFYITSFIVICFSFLYSINLSSEIKAFKLFVIFASMLCINLLDPKKIELTIYYSIIFITLYSIIILLDYNKALSFLRQSNYLTISFPIGISLSMVLVSLIIDVYNKKKSLFLNVIFILISFIDFFALLKFSARGSIIFPFFVLLFALLFLSIKKASIKTFKILLFIVVIIFIFYLLYINNTTSIDFNRMMRLFENTESESRWSLWNYYIDYCINNEWFIFGGGTYSSELIFGIYPHNLFLQFAGEFGLIGIISCVINTICVLIVQFKALSISIKNKNIDNKVLFIIVGGLIYLFLIHLKSYSIYDSSILFIFVSLTMTYSVYVLKKNKMEGKI